MRRLRWDRRGVIGRFEYAALDLKLREIRHTCVALCVLSADEDPGAPEAHYEQDRLGFYRVWATWRDRVRLTVRWLRGGAP